MACIFMPCDMSKTEQNVSFLKSAKKQNESDFPSSKTFKIFVLPMNPKALHRSFSAQRRISALRHAHSARLHFWISDRDYTRFDRKAERGRGIELYKHKALIAWFH